MMADRNTQTTPAGGTNMAESVQHIIDRIRAIREQLAARFASAAAGTARERARMVLDYIGRHERHMGEALARYETSASRAVLDTWFKNTPGRPVEECVSLLRIDAEDLDEVVRSVLAMDACLVETYRRIGESAVAEDVRDFFRHLIEMEQREEHRLIRDAIEVNDL
jgi:rubrerythrin